MSSQWADQPYALISTQPFSKNASHAAYYVATQMALAHNGILRGLNAIYLQATHIPREDLTTIQDFLVYCQCWSESMHHHHEAEEQIFFPSVEQVTGVPGIMERNKEQHRAFTPGFDRFQEYARTCPPHEFEGTKVKRLVEDFAEPLTLHLRDEIETLKALDAYDSEQVRQAYKRLEKELMATDNVSVALGRISSTKSVLVSNRTAGVWNRRQEFRSGMHDFPSVPFFVPYIIQYLFGRRHRGAWRFNPCTAWRDRRELAFRGENIDA